MWIIGNKSGEFHERLTLSQLEANHHLIFLVYLVIIRCIRVYPVINQESSWFKYERSTTRRWVSKKDNNSSTSARGLVLYITFLLRKLGGASGPVGGGADFVGFFFFFGAPLRGAKKKKNCTDKISRAHFY
jgi:hypothetical protein